MRPRPPGRCPPCCRWRIENPESRARLRYSCAQASAVRVRLRAMYALAIHGGAGALPRSQFSPKREQEYRLALAAALAAGQGLLENGGSALDAVEAAVTVLEDNPLFNAGRGAVLCDDGSVELDA